MITAYVRTGDTLRAVPLERGAELPAGAVWLDLLRPEEAEREGISNQLGVDLPTREDMSEIEASSRLYVEDAAVFLTTPVLSRGDDGHPELGFLTFVLTQTVLITVRHTEPLWFSIFAARAMRRPGLASTPPDVMLGLLEAVVDRAADILETVRADLDRLSRQIFIDSADTEKMPEKPNRQMSRRQAVQRRRAKVKAKDDMLRRMITAIGRAGGLVHKVRDSLAGLERLCVFAAAMVGPHLSKEQKARLKTIDRGVHSLVEHAAFQAMQTNFLLDATLGVINIQQNNIIKIFSVAAVGFLPPTLVASIYGMNFKYMPELDWAWGYPMALLLTVIVAILPLLFFKKRGWF